MSNAPLNPVVHAIGQLHRTGDIVPHAWFQQPKLRFANGRPNLIAMHVLANILYWYTPTLVRNEYTQQITEVKTKFRADKLQVSYKKMGEYFGFSKRQVADAVYFLIEAGFVTRELRDVSLGPLGTMYSCVFLEPVVPAIIAINEVQAVPLPEDFYDSEDGEGGEGGQWMGGNVPAQHPPGGEGAYAGADTPLRPGVAPPAPQRRHSSKSSPTSSSNQDQEGAPERPPASAYGGASETDQTPQRPSTRGGRPCTPNPPQTSSPLAEKAAGRGGARAGGGIGDIYQQETMPDSLKHLWDEETGEYIGPPGEYSEDWFIANGYLPAYPGYKPYVPRPSA